MKKRTNLIGIIVITCLLASGCATEKKVVTETTTTPSGTERIVEREVIIEKERTQPGLLGATFNFIGEVLAFPFDVIGGVFRAIF